MDYNTCTREYYGNWLGDASILQKEIEGIRWLFSPERNQAQAGYGQPFNLYLWVEPKGLVVSYGDRFAPIVSEIKNQIKAVPTIEELKEFLSARFKVVHFIKYQFVQLPALETKARPLEEKDYPAYEDFFRANNPNCQNVDWLHDYFSEMVQEGLCCGIFSEKILVSCTDSPIMPYLPERVQEIGINTRTDFRGKGYAADAVTTCIRQILKQGKCPQWSTTVSNLLSQKLASRVGFQKLADVLTVAE